MLDLFQLTRQSNLICPLDEMPLTVRRSRRKQFFFMNISMNASIVKPHFPCIHFICFFYNDNLTLYMIMQLSHCEFVFARLFLIRNFYSVFNKLFFS